MSAVAAMIPEAQAQTPRRADPPEVNLALLESAIHAACQRIAPLWPLQHFVAVNPFLGFADQGFAATCAALRRIAGIDMLMPRAFYRAALADGVIAPEDLEAARIAVARACEVPDSVAAVRAAIASEPAADLRPDARIATVAELLDTLADGDRQASRTDFMISEIARWCAAHFNQAQSPWPAPGQGAGLYRGWRMAMRHDRNAEAMGIRGFRKAIAALPDDPVAAIAEVVADLGIPAGAMADYLHRALLDIRGWAGYARYLAWQGDLHGRPDDALVGLLAVRVAWGYALYRERTDAPFRGAWQARMQAARIAPADPRADDDPDLAIDLIAHHAFEHAAQRRLLAKLATAPMPETDGRKAVQAVFCIDVRSEVYRRALESVYPRAETFGFAGFFGFPVEYVRLGHERGDAQCPVLLKPSFIVCESLRCADSEQQRRAAALRRSRLRVAQAWQAFRQSAVSCFAYVESLGWLFAPKLASDSLGWRRTKAEPATPALAPDIAPGAYAGRTTGLDAEQRVDAAEALLRGMSLTRGFARLVVLAGHASTSANNPHAASLDCGACGGHSGEVNARIAAAVLNDPATRLGLAARGIAIPDDTWFLGCLHDTTTDDVRIFDAASVPATHAPDLDALRIALAQASALVRAERAPALGVANDAQAGTRIKARSRDWSQVRPEWGLAGNCAFIAAPRSRTRGIDLHGRVFLHSYDWHDDAGFAVLETILTAPLVVASWINLQYYGSTVNNRAFGAGNKVLHNVVGAIGVIEGNAGDLKTGLPLQSVHDGNRFVHEPLRLNAIVAAPLDAINRMIDKHAALRELVDNDWIHLFAMADSGAVTHRYAGALAWEALP